MPRYPSLNKQRHHSILPGRVIKMSEVKRGVLYKALLHIKTKTEDVPDLT